MSNTQLHPFQSGNQGHPLLIGATDTLAKTAGLDDLTALLALAPRLGMPTSPQTLVFTRAVKGGPAEAWAALSTPGGLAEWFMEADMTPEKGTRFTFEGGWEGRVLRVEPPRVITFQTDEGGLTRFEVLGGPGALAVRITDTMPPGMTPPDEAEEDHSQALLQPLGPGTHWAGLVAGWHAFADELAAVLGEHAAPPPSLTPVYAALLGHLAQRTAAAETE